MTNTRKINKEIKSFLMPYVGYPVTEDLLSEIKKGLYHILRDNGFPDDSIVPNLNTKVAYNEKARKLLVAYRPQDLEPPYRIHKWSNVVVSAEKK